MFWPQKRCGTVSPLNFRITLIGFGVTFCRAKKSKVTKQNKNAILKIIYSTLGPFVLAHSFWSRNKPKVNKQKQICSFCKSYIKAELGQPNLAAHRLKKIQKQKNISLS